MQFASGLWAMRLTLPPGLNLCEQLSDLPIPNGMPRRGVLPVKAQAGRTASRMIDTQVPDAFVRPLADRLLRELQRTLPQADHYIQCS